MAMTWCFLLLFEKPSWVDSMVVEVIMAVAFRVWAFVACPAGVVVDMATPKIIMA